jgi:hypothetical protein
MLHQGGTSNTTTESNLHNSVSGNDDRAGLHQVRRKNSIVLGLPQSGPSMDLHHSVVGSSSGVTVGLHQGSSSMGDSNTQSHIPLGSSALPMNTPVASPPSISNLLELSLPSAVGEDLAVVTGSSSTVLLDASVQDSSATLQPSFVGELSALQIIK